MVETWLQGLPLAGVFAVLGVCAIVIALAGSALAGEADAVADQTGLGEAMVGALFLGAVTSLPGIITSAAAAWQGLPELSVANAVGGITAQTAFLAIADLTYRRANLEHAAASLSALAQAAILIAILCVPLVAFGAPDVTLFGVHPATPVLLIGYVYGVRVIGQARAAPMWSPRVTRETQAEEVDGAEDPPPPARSGLALWSRFLALGLVTALAGYVVSQAAVVLSARTAIGEAAIGGLLTAIITSLPELVTTLAAVRRRALTLALGGILGGNVFDTLFLAVSDIAYRPGSIYHEMTETTVFSLAAAILMTGVLMLGLLRRQEEGPARIGFESLTVLAVYAVFAAGVAI